MERISAKKALEHPWFQIREQKLADDYSSKNQQIDSETLQQLLAFRGMCQVRMAALDVLVKLLEKKDLK